MLVSFLYLSQAASLFLFLAHITVLISPARSKQHGSRRTLYDGHSDDAGAIGYGHDEQEHSTAHKLIAMRKMTGTEEEMFFQDFWRFDLETPKLPKEPPSKAISTPEIRTNASLVLPLQHPFALHRVTDESSANRHWARGLHQPNLWDRAFQCPTGTDACTGIDRPDSCCPSGNTCQLVTNTGQGDVACCGSGQTCAGEVQDCAPGYQSCPGDAGGGCCVPGYACVGTVGCTFLHLDQTSLC